METISAAVVQGGVAMQTPLEIIEDDCPYWDGIPEVDDDCRHWTQLMALQSSDAIDVRGSGRGTGIPLAAQRAINKGEPGT